MLWIWSSLSILSWSVSPCPMPTSTAWLVAGGDGEGPGKFVATSLSREPLGRWALKLEPRVREPKYSACRALAGDRGSALEGDSGLGLGGRLGRHACCLSWGFGRTGAALGSTSRFPVKVHTREKRPFPVLLHCRALREAELGLESRVQGTEEVGDRSGE